MRFPKVIVTGGAGFIGSHLTDALIKKGCEVVVVDTLVAGTAEHVNVHARLAQVDIRNFSELLGEFYGAQVVFHLAALPRVQYSIEHPLLTHAVNVTGTANVLEAARIAGVSRVIYSASSSAYGDQIELPLREDMHPDPLSPYGAQKYMGEVLCRVSSQVFGLRTVCLRYFNVYGPRFNPEGAYALVIGKFITQRLKGHPLTITGDGMQTRDFTHVSDVVRANLLAMHSPLVAPGEVINIGAGHNVSINRLADLIGGPTEHVPARPEPRNTLADRTKAREVLGWVPRVSFEQGIAELKAEFGV